MFDHIRQSFFRAVRRALGRIVRAGLLGLLVGAAAAELAGFALNGGWPPQVFTHVTAATLGVLLAYAMGVTVALAEGVRGLVAAAGEIDDVAKAAASAGINVVDAMVDAVDGPERHGIR